MFAIGKLYQEQTGTEKDTCMKLDEHIIKF